MPIAEQELTHNTNKLLKKIKSIPIAQQLESNGKPRGFWYACNNEWIKWIKVNMPKWEGKRNYKIELDYTNVLRIKNIGELEQFNNKYSVQMPWGNWAVDGGEYVNWKEVAKTYKGIEICPWISQGRRYVWYSTWDVASGCIWDASAVKSITPITVGKKKTIKKESPMLKTLIKEILNNLQEASKEVSAGILLWRKNEENKIEVLLALPGGPFYVGKDAGSWGIPKGELESGENPAAAAVREFTEETGHTPKGKAVKLPSAILKSGKTVHAWAVEDDMDPSSFSSNTFDLEWPPKSGKVQSFPEIDRVEWFSVEEAKTKMVGAQQVFVDALISLIK